MKIYRCNDLEALHRDCSHCQCCCCCCEPVKPDKPDRDKPQLRGIQVLLTGAGGALIPNGGSVLFNSVINNQTHDISYSAGNFTISAPGNYFVTWWVATDNVVSLTVTFEVRINGGGGIPGSSPLVVGQVNGSAFITINSAPAILTLVNNSGGTATLSSTPAQASIIITEVK